MGAERQGTPPTPAPASPRRPWRVARCRPGAPFRERFPAKSRLVGKRADSEEDSHEALADQGRWVLAGRSVRRRRAVVGRGLQRPGPENPREEGRRAGQGTPSAAAAPTAPAAPPTAPPAPAAAAAAPPPPSPSRHGPDGATARAT